MTAHFLNNLCTFLYSIPAAIFPCFLAAFIRKVVHFLITAHQGRIQQGPYWLQPPLEARESQERRRWENKKNRERRGGRREENILISISWLDPPLLHIYTHHHIHTMLAYPWLMGMLPTHLYKYKSIDCFFIPCISMRYGMFASVSFRQVAWEVCRLSLPLKVRIFLRVV